MVEDVDIIWITGSGRSGTTWLANVLDHAKHASAFHEPDGGEHEFTRKSINNPWVTSEYLASEKMPRVKERIEEMPKSHDKYIEVNSFLRNSHKELQEYGGVIHLVRNPRYCVRSHLQRNSVIQDGEWCEVTPKKGFYERVWSEMNNFEKACWYWWRPNKKLFYDETVDALKVELIGDRAYYTQSLWALYNIDIPAENWDEITSGKANQTEGDFLIPEPEEWGEKLNESFEIICGDLERQMGYNTDGE